MLSTLHDYSADENRKSQIIWKYNIGKAFVNISDQMTGFYPYVKKTMKWYLEIFFHIATQTADVNVRNVYQLNSALKAKIVELER